MFYKHFVCECHNYAHTATMSMYKMLVSLAKLLNKSYNKLERFSIMTKNYAYSMKQPSLLWVCLR